jgi:hypothetical protein
MKITKKNVDGSTEEIEGTAEELAEFENKSSDKKKKESKEKSDKLLLGISEESLRQIIAQEVAKIVVMPVTTPTYPVYPQIEPYKFPWDIICNSNLCENTKPIFDSVSSNSIKFD